MRVQLGSEISEFIKCIFFLNCFDRFLFRQFCSEISYGNRKTDIDYDPNTFPDGAGS